MPNELSLLVREFPQWVITRTSDPHAWIAVKRSGTAERVLAAYNLAALLAKIRCAERE
jgi:hypothetical protein